MGGGYRTAALCLAIGAGGVASVLGLAWRNTSHAQAAVTAPAQPGVPVVVATARRQDVPVIAEGIGTVQAFQSVLIQARVTGWLDRIAFTEGQMVKKGDLLAVIDPRPYADALAQAQAKLASDQAMLDNDQVNYRRDAALAQRSYQTQQQVDNDASAVRVMQATVQGDQAAIQTAVLNLSFCQITTPVDGVAGLRLIDQGNLIQAGSGQGIVTITQIQPISVVFTLPQSDLPAIQAAQAAGQPPVAAFGQDDRTPLDTGTLIAASNSINAATGTIQLKATFANADRKLWPGQFVNAHLQLSVARNAVTVPIAAVQHGPDGLYVFVIGPDDTTASKPITVGYQDRTLAVVSTGLNGGEQVVVQGQSRLQDGTRVSARTAQART